MSSPPLKWFEKNLCACFDSWGWLLLSLSHPFKMFCFQMKFMSMGKVVEMLTSLVCYEQYLRLCFEFGIKLLGKGFMRYLVLYSLTGNMAVTPIRLFHCHIS